MQGLLLTFKGLAALGDRAFVDTVKDICKLSKVVSLLLSIDPPLIGSRWRMQMFVMGPSSLKDPSSPRP
jgi:hypothetical protein